MFDLEKAVESWRASLPGQMRGRGEEVEELEQHLRDAFEQRVQAGGRVGGGVGCGGGVNGSDARARA